MKNRVNKFLILSMIFSLLSTTLLRTTTVFAEVTAENKTLVNDSVEESNVLSNASPSDNSNINEKMKENEIINVEDDILYYKGEELFINDSDQIDGKQISASLEDLMQQGVERSLTTRSTGAGAAIVFKGYITDGLSTVGNFSVNGKQAFCLEHPKNSPPTGNPNQGLVPYTNENIKRVLYYGYGGPKSIFEGDSFEDAFITTTLVLSAYYNGDVTGTYKSKWQTLYNLGQTGHLPSTTVVLSKSKLNVGIDSGKQKSESTTLNADSENEFKINIPNGITFINETTNQSVTNGQASFKGGDTFHLEAALNYTNNYNSGKLAGSIQDFQPFVIKPINESYQVLGTWQWYDDPAKQIEISANFFAREGYGKIKKIDESGNLLANAKFSIKDTKTGVVEEQVTDDTGEITVKYLHGTNLEIQEILAPNQYVRNKETFKISIEAGETKEITVSNKKQKGLARLFKEDKETGNTLQGQAILENAVYGLYQADGTKIKEVTLKNINGKVQAEIADLQLGDYYWQEIKAPVGYNLDKTKVPFTISYAGQDVEVSVKEAVAKDQVIKGSFDILKHANYDWKTKAWNWITGNNSSEEQKKGLENVEFTVFETWGDKKKVANKKTDLQGYVSFDDLPYGTYRVSETSTPEGYKKISDFTVTISEQGQTFHYSIENKVKESKVKVVKVDSETGKTIPRAEAAFEVYSETTGKKLVMKDLNNKDVSVFYTDKNGELQLPTMFAYGKYKLKEVKAPIGYILSKEEVKFSVTGEEKDNIVLIKFKNDNQKGQINLHKNIKTATNVIEKESEYGKYTEIQYTSQNGAGVIFKVKANKDIVTPDGTVRLKKGQYVQHNNEDLTLVTDSEGNVKSPASLFIGDYDLEEVKAPLGVIKISTPITFIIKYAGQVLDVTSTKVSIENEVQKLKIVGYKSQEFIQEWKDEEATIGLEKANNGQVFALRNAEEQTIGSSTLAADTTLQYVKVEDGQFVFEGYLPEGKYYFEEINAGSDHVLDNTKYYFEYTAQDNLDEQTIHVWSDEYAINVQELTQKARNPIINKLARQDIELLKVEKDSEKPLENVVFNLVQVTDKEEITIGKYATDKDGKILVKNLPTGKYKFVEIQPLYLYNPNTEDLSFEVKPATNGEKISIKATNEKRQPQVGTLLATITGSKDVDVTVDNVLRDTINLKDFEKGTYTKVAELVELDENGKEVAVVSRVEEQKTITEYDSKDYAEFKIPKNTLKADTNYVCREYYYKDKQKKEVYAKHDDLTNKDQTIRTKKLVFKKILPQTGETNKNIFILLGLSILLVVSFVYFSKKNKKA